MSRPKMLNVAHCPRKFIDDPEFRTAIKTLRLGAAAGSRRIYLNIDRVKPGARSVKYHAHSRQEEFFLILSGTGILRINGRRLKIKKGDFVAKPAGRGIAHQFINAGSNILEILDCGSVEPDDVVFYPDEGVRLRRKSGLALKNGRPVKGWSSDPNGKKIH